jgi:hypothetical protein
MPRRVPIDLILAAAYLACGLAWVALLPGDARLDRDEGFNLMKADLVAGGYRLYSEIWSDQPPLFTHMLVAWREAFGDSDRAARSLVVLLTSIGLASAGRLTTWMARGDARAGVLAILLLLGARSIPKLGMAVMIGLPAVSVALLAIVLLRAAMRWGLVGTVAAAGAGALFAAAMQIKLFAFILLPMAVVIALFPPPSTLGGGKGEGPFGDRKDGDRNDDGGDNALPLTPSQSTGRGRMALLVFALAWAVSTYWLAPFHEPVWKQQLLVTHMKTGLPTDDSQLASLRSIASRFLEDGPLMLAAGVCVFLAGREAARRALPAIVWLASSVVVLSQANPLWGHHRVMFSIPAAMIAAVAFGIVWSDAERRKRQIATIAVGIALSWGAVQLAFAVATLGRGDDAHDPQILSRLREIAAQNDSTEPTWVISDDPHVVRAAGMLVPPEVAVLSLKRLQRDLSEDALAAVVQKYRPVAILLARHNYSDTFASRVAVGYEPAFAGKNGRVRLFRRRDGESTTLPSTRP